MSFCPRCGTEIDPGSAFCKACGAPVAGPAPEAPQMSPPPAPEQAFRAPPPPPGMEPPPAGEAFQAPPAETAAPPTYQGAVPSYEPAYAAPAKKGGGGKFVLLGLLGLLVVGAVVVLVLGFAVGPKWFVGGGSGPEETVEKYFQALEKGDAKLMVSLIEPSQRERLAEEVKDYYDSVEELFREYYKETFPEGDLKISGLQFDSEIDGDEATVTVVAGKATYTDSYGDEITESVEDPEDIFYDTKFNLKKVGGTWYLFPELD